MPALVDLEHHFSVQELRKAFEQLEEAKRDKFRDWVVKIPTGADGIEYADFKRNLERNLREISKSVLSGKYIFYPLRQVDIPKDPKYPTKGTRTLSVARIRDILVQKQLYKALYERTEEWFQVKPLDSVSLAYRKGKSAHDAIQGIWRNFHDGFVYALDADLCQFFDTLNHDYLLRQVDTLLDPASIERKLIFRYIKTRYVNYAEYSHLDKIERKRYFMKHKPPNPQRRTQGVPQGGVLSGMLANLYLHEFDKWVVEILGKHFALRYYRYADDFVILTRTEADANAIYEPVEAKLHEIHLSMHPVGSDKTRIVYIPIDKLEFLGFRITSKHIQVKPKNVTRFKESFRKSIKRLEKHETTDPEKLIAEIVKYYTNSKVLGPPDDCSKCGLPRRRYNWISFFAPVITDTIQLHQLDVWMRREIEQYLFRRFGVKVKNRQQLLDKGMNSLLREYWRYRRKRFCVCEGDEHSILIETH